MRDNRRGLVIVWGIVWVFFGLANAVSAQPRPPVQPAVSRRDESHAIAELLKTQPTAAVIVWLKDTPVTAPTYQADLARKRAAIKAAQTAVLSTLSPDDFTLTHQYQATNGFAGIVTASGLEKLRAHPQVAQVFMDRRMRASLIESRVVVGADQVESALGVTGSGITVCVVDTGVDYNHPNLTVVGGDDFIEFDGDPMDDHGHGTHVAGIVASTDGTYRGVAPGAGIAAVKVLDANGQGDASSIGAGIDWCVNNASLYSIKVITMSLGEQSGEYTAASCPTYLDPLIENAANAGIFVDAASGNAGFIDGISYPACAPNVTSVGATYDADVGPKSWAACSDGSTQADQLACFTNRWLNLDLLAPGSVITSTTSGNGSGCGAPNGGGFGDCSGTSMAAPHVAGAAALLLEAKPSLQPGDIENLLIGTGVAVSDPLLPLTFPRIDILAAINESNNPPVLAPIGSQTVQEGQQLVVQLFGSDPDSTPVTFAIDPFTVLPSSFFFNPANGIFVWTPTFNDSGTYAVTFSVSDGQLTDHETVLITVLDAAVNSPPVLQPIGNQQVTEAETLTIQLAATDAENDPLTFSTNAASVLPSSSSFNTVTGLFSWTPTLSDAGNYTVTFSVSDGQASDQEPILITVVNAPPSPLCGTSITASTVLAADVLNCPTNGLSIGADNITLDCAGHTIRAGDGLGDAGVRAMGRTNVTIKNCVVQGFQQGIILDTGTTNSLVVNNTANGTNNFGIRSFNASNNTFQLNTAYGNNIGFNIVAGSTNETFISNTSRNNGVGFHIASSWLNTVTTNTIKDNTAIGILVSDGAHDNTIKSNTIKGNNKGIELNPFLFAPSVNNRIYNNIFSNTINAVDYPQNTNIWNIPKTVGGNIVGGPFLGGNSWSDYTGADTSGDWLGDTQLPYTSNGGITNGGDALPLIKPPCPMISAHGTWPGGTWQAKSTCPKQVL